jgi:hypothetical protein
MITTDEVFKQIQYRSQALASLTEEAMKVLPKESHTVDGMTDYISARFQGMIRGNGARYTPDNIKDEAMTNFFRAIRESEKSGKPLPDEFKDRDDYITNYFAKNYDANRSALADYSMDWAEDSTFTRGLNTDMDELVKLGYLRSAVDASKSGSPQTVGSTVQDFVSQHSMARVIAPFVRTPMNLMSFPMRRIWLPDPVMRALVNKKDGWFSKMHMKYKADMLSGDPRRAAMAVGRLRSGGLMYSSMIALASTGTVTGAGPKDPDKRNAWLAAGQRPYSIKIGDKFISYSRLDPFATPIGLAADYTYMVKEAIRTGDFNENAVNVVAMSMIFSLADNLTSKTYLQGFSDFLSVMTDPSKGGAAERMLTRHSSSYIPKALSQFAHLFGDGAMRKPRTFLQALQSKIPILANSIDPMRNLLGQPIKYTDDSIFWRGLAVMNPFLVKTISNNNVLETLAGMEYGFSLPQPQIGGQPELDMRNFKDDDGRSAWDWFQERVGTIRDKSGNTLEDRLDSLFSSPFFLGLTKQYNEQEYRGTGPDANDMRVTLTKSVFQEFRSMARDETKRRFPDIQRVMASLAYGNYRSIQNVLDKYTRN